MKNPTFTLMASYLSTHCREQQARTEFLWIVQRPKLESLSSSLEMKKASNAACYSMQIVTLRNTEKIRFSFVKTIGTALTQQKTLNFPSRCFTLTMSYFRNAIFTKWFKHLLRDKHETPEELKERSEQLFADKGQCRKIFKIWRN